MGHFNVSARGMSDAILVLDIDDLASDSEVMPRVLDTPGFPGMNGDGRLYLSGFSGSDDEDGSVRLWVVNLKPSVDPVTKDFLDHAKFGANTTIELFRTGSKAEKLDHLKTFVHPQIVNPNRVAAVGGNSNAFYFTNDHGTIKTGLKFHISPLIGTGDVSYCDETSCRQVASSLKFPNGLAKGGDGRIYVPSSMLGLIDIFQPQINGDLVKVDSINANYVLDNLSPDRNGNIYAAAIPDAMKFFAANKDPLNKNAPTTALKITKNAKGQYEVSKEIEDGMNEVLPGATTVLHDYKTGRLFFSGESLHGFLIS
ncbi:hypothetical protein TruAng_006014 [Truncatella angustata]|nr:hypothetical protein TruAng_006014 [Truncatella angustata]